MLHLRSSLFLASVAIATAMPAIAKPVAVASVPAPDSSVAKPNRVEIRLSEPVAPGGASIDLNMTGMPGMAHHGAMKISGFKTVLGAGGKSLVAVLPRPLPAGTYQVKWTATGKGRGAGLFNFTVK